MRKIDGKIVFTNISEVVSAKHTALLVIDVQGNCGEGHGATLRRISEVLQVARNTGIMIIYFRNVRLSHYNNISSPYLRLLLKGGHRPGKDPIPLLKDSSETKIVSQIAPKPGEIVIDKPRASAFVGTQLDTILRSNGILSLVLVGCSTDWCVEATVWDATGRDYYAVVLEDCVAGPRWWGHKAALKQFAVIADVIKAKEAVEIWKRQRQRISS